MAVKKDYWLSLISKYNGVSNDKISELDKQKDYLIKETESLYNSNQNIKELEVKLARYCELGDIYIKNNIKEKVEEFCELNGVNKKWIAQKLHMSKQALSECFKSINPRLDTLIKISLLIECDITDLFDYEVQLID